MTDHCPTPRIAAIGLVLLICCQSLAAQEVAKPFEEALEAAQAYPIQWNQVGSFEHAIDLFEKIIKENEGHPRLGEAKFAEFQVLAMSDKTDQLAKADKLIRDVVSNASGETPLGRTARMSFVAFQVNKARSLPFEDLKQAATVLSEMEAGLDPKSVERARWVEHKATLLRREGRKDEALTTLVDYYRETYTWPEETWVDLKTRSPDQYQGFRQAFMSLNNEMVRIIGSSTDPNISAILRNAPLGVIIQPRVNGAWKEFEERHILGSGQTFEELQASIIRASIGNIGNMPPDPLRQSSSGTGSAGTQARQTTTTPGNTNTSAKHIEDNERTTIGWWVGVLVVVPLGVGTLWAIRRRRANKGKGDIPHWLGNNEQHR